MIRRKIHQPTNAIILHKETLNNHLDSEFQQMLKPCNFVQKIHFFSRYKVQNGFVAPNDLKRRLRSFLATFLYMSYLISRLTLFKNSVLKSPTMSSSLFVLVKGCQLAKYMLFTSGFLVNIKSAIWDSCCNVLFVIKIQQAYREMRKYQKFSDRAYFVTNFIAIFSILVTIGLAWLYNALTHNTAYYEYILDFIISLFEFNILNAIQFIVLIRINFLNWFNCLKSFDEVSASTRSTFVDIMNTAYYNMMFSYRLFPHVFQDLVLCYIVSTFGHAMILATSSTAFIQVVSKTKFSFRFDWKFFYLLTVVQIKSLSLLFVLGMQMEKYYVDVETAQAYITHKVLSEKISEHERRVLKNMSREYRARWTATSARGVVRLAATLPLQLISISATYVIVILQFALT